MNTSKAKEETSRQCKNHLTKGKQETWYMRRYGTFTMRHWRFCGQGIVDLCLPVILSSWKWLIRVTCYSVAGVVSTIKEKNNLKTQDCWLYLVNIRLYQGNSKRLYSHRNWCYNSASLSIFSLPPPSPHPTPTPPSPPPTVVSFCHAWDKMFNIFVNRVVSF